jgi:hypothetical protein
MAVRGARVLDELRVSGIAVMLFVACLVLPALPGAVADALEEPLLEYRENGQTVQVRTGDGCLVYRKDISSRGRDEVLSYCPARVPEGADGWAPQLRDFYTVDATGRTVTELVLFGIVPDQVARARVTLPGGQTVEAATRRVADVRHPVVLLHLRHVALPVDLTETDGRTVFVRLELFDPDGREVPVV